MEHRKQDLMEANTRVIRRQETEQEGKVGMVDSDPQVLYSGFMKGILS